MDSSKIRLIAAWVLAVALAAVFLSSGVWKLWAPAQAGIRQVETGVPSIYALPFAVVLGSLEVLAGILILWPAWRREGAVLIGLQLAAFMTYMGLRYSQLKGMECGCMPGRHRALGAGFFIEDGLMLAGAIGVVLLARPAASRFAQVRARSWMRPLLIFLIVLAIGGGSAMAERTLGASAMSLRVKDREGRVAVMPLSPRSYTLLYFYNPTCMNCAVASAQIAKLQLGAPLVVVPEQQPDTAYDYLQQKGIKNAIVSLDYGSLSEKFHLKQVPTIYIMQGSRQVNMIINFEPDQLRRALAAYNIVH